MNRYTIRTGRPYEHVRPDSMAWEDCETLEVARQRAAGLSRRLRTDVRVGIERGGVIVEESGCHSGPYTGATRHTTPRGDEP